jgi:hypothetical protein
MDGYYDIEWEDADAVWDEYDCYDDHGSYDAFL